MKTNNLLKYTLTSVLLLVFAGWFQSNLQAQTIVTDIDDLREAINAAQPGDEIVVKDGVYQGSGMTIEASGTAEAPITIRAENILGVELSDEASFNLRGCENLIFSGFLFTSTDRTVFKLQSCKNIRITRNHFKLNETESLKWIIIQGIWNDAYAYSSNNRIDHNVFENKTQPGNFITIDGTIEPTYQISQYDRIDHNYFKTNQPRVENEKEAIRVGVSTLSESSGYTTIEYNLFEECDGDPEIISIKCDDTSIRYNTFRRCKGTLSLRHGDRSVVEGNFFFGEGIEGTGGVRIYGDDHVIINNHFEGLTGTKWDAPITLTQGDAESGSGSLSKHFRINRAIIAYNTLVNNEHGIEIGYDNNGNYNKPPRDVTFAYNLISGAQNELVLIRNEAENTTWLNNVFFTSATAIMGSTFSEGEVQNIDPMLSFDTYYKATSSTPRFTIGANTTWKPSLDIHQQERTGSNTVGADEWSESASKNEPLTSSDVGVYASESNYLNVNPRTISVEATASEIPIQITTDLNWTVAENSDWLDLSSAQGNKSFIITLYVSENTSYENRNASFAITAGNKTETVQVVQAGKVSSAQLSIAESLFIFGSQAENQTLSLEANLDWSVKSKSDFVNLSPENGNGTTSISIGVSENATTGLRAGEIVFQSENKEASVKILQDGRYGNETPQVATDASATHEDGGNVAANVLDDSFDTRWSGQGDGTSITLDLGTVRNLSYLEMSFYKGNQRQTFFDIQLSENGTDFTTVLSGLFNSGTSTDLEKFNFLDQNAQYVRIIGHGNSSNDWNSITQIKVYGSENSQPLNILDQSNDLAIYPTCVKDYFYINGTKRGSKLQIINLDGKITSTLVLNNDPVHKIHLENVPSGIYFIRLSTRYYNRTTKIMKTN